MATVVLFYEPPRLVPSVVAAPEVAEVSVDGFTLGENEVSFARLYRRAYDVAFQLLGYRAEAEDVAQESMARAYIHWPKIHGYAEPWVVRVAGNLAIGSWRKNRRLGPLPEADTDGAHDDGGPGANLADHLELRRALGRLSKRQREVVILRHLAGYSERETAATLGCSNGTVKQHSSRGLAALREFLTIDLTDENMAERKLEVQLTMAGPLEPQEPAPGADVDDVDQGAGARQLAHHQFDPAHEGEL